MNRTLAHIVLLIIGAGVVAVALSVHPLPSACTAGLWQ